MDTQETIFKRSIFARQSPKKSFKNWWFGDIFRTGRNFCGEGSGGELIQHPIGNSTVLDDYLPSHCLCCSNSGLQQVWTRVYGLLLNLETSEKNLSLQIASSLLEQCLQEDPNVAHVLDTLLTQLNLMAID